MAGDLSTPRPPPPTGAALLLDIIRGLAVELRPTAGRVPMRLDSWVAGDLGWLWLSCGRGFEERFADALPDDVLGAVTVWQRLEEIQAQLDAVTTRAAVEEELAKIKDRLAPRPAATTRHTVSLPAAVRPAIPGQRLGSPPRRRAPARDRRMPRQNGPGGPVAHSSPGAR